MAFCRLDLENLNACPQKGEAENYSSILHHLLRNHSHSTASLYSDHTEIMAFLTPHSSSDTEARLN